MTPMAGLLGGVVISSREKQPSKVRREPVRNGRPLYFL
jgi:hypothetical protein